MCNQIRTVCEVISRAVLFVYAFALNSLGVMPVSFLK